MKKRRIFTRDLKVSVVRELEAGKSIAQVCREHLVHPSLVGKWRRQWRENPQRAFSGPGKVSSLEAQVAERDRLLGQLYAECAFLKKALRRLEALHAEYRSKK